MSAQGSAGRFTRNFETTLEGESVSGEVEFALNEHAPRNNLLDYFYFVDANGEAVDATGGHVLVTMSPVLPLYQKLSDGEFDAIVARDNSWPKPNGYGKAVSIKFTFTGITGAPTGFRALVTQSVS